MLRAAVSGTAATAGIPGVVAMATNRAGTIYSGVAGKRRLGAGADMTTDTLFSLFSCTKAVTATALMQAVEEGLIELDDAAETYVPEIAEVAVLDGFDGETPRLRAPRRKITLRHLLLHTAGFGYDFFNADVRKYNRALKIPSINTNCRAALHSILLFDPGERWEYGTSIDWAGLVIEAVRGQRLGEIFAQRIFAPLGIHDMGFELTPSMRDRLAGMHRRTPDGLVEPLPDVAFRPVAEMQMGGHGLYGTVGDYMKIIGMFLNDGAGPHGRVLRPETILAMQRNGLGSQTIHELPAVIPAVSNTVELFPGVPKSWGLSFMINDVDAPTGRPAGALGWAGLGNLFYWIDRRSGIGGMWATQIFPFADSVSMAGWEAFETAIYGSIAPAADG